MPTLSIDSALVSLQARKAYMGYAIGHARTTVRLCSYCPDARHATRDATLAAMDSTHGICPTCYAAQLEALRLG